MKARTKHATLDLKRTQTLVPVRVTPEEKARFVKVAESRHTNLSELIRQMLHAEADKLDEKWTAA